MTACMCCMLCPFKPLFHCNAKPLALGPRVGLDPQRDDFVLGIPACWYLKSVGARVGHVDFMLFVSISFVLGSQRERNFWWNMGFRVPMPSINTNPLIQCDTNI